MISNINTAVCVGVRGEPVNVETNIAKGIPGISIVGLASTTVMESRERIKAAILNTGLEFPRNKVIVNLTPAYIRKNGSCLDLPIAVSILSASLYVDQSGASEYGIIGELSLDGSVRGVCGVLPMVLRMAESGIGRIIVPYDNFGEAKLVEGAKIIPVKSLKECIRIINEKLDRNPMPGNTCASDGREELRRISNPDRLDFADIKGQENAKRAITIAVAGRHGLIMIGSPGCGKSMLAKRIPTIMPDMSRFELIETAIVYSVAGRNDFESAISVDRPFRSPNNTIGRAGLLGGGAIPVPGEITLAHNGVLFLDEICEFDRDSIEALRLPIEEKTITHFRGGTAYSFPCDFQLVMAANPCKCGYYGDPVRMCRCTQSDLESYRRKLSGPMMDRIDLRINMEKVDFEQMRNRAKCGVSSAEMKADVERGIAFARTHGRNRFNGVLTDAEAAEFCRLGYEEECFMSKAYDKLELSPRSYGKILKVARTVADLAESEAIRTEHLAEAISYRMTEEINKGI